MPIKPQKYNAARSILANAGSQSAAKSHPKHAADGDARDDHGKSLLREARDEFRETDKDHPERDKKSRMTQPHYDAIHEAAETMNLGAPKGPRNGSSKEKKW
jgi:hypothetical protein